VSASLPHVLRRPLTILLLPLALVGVAGCTTFTDNDAVARVGDVELGRSEFEQQLAELGVTDQDVLSLDPVRSEITRWIQTTLLDDDQLGELYDAGPAESGTICLAAIVVEDEETANAARAELDNGAPFIDVFEANNIDGSLAAEGGSLPCIGAADLQASAGVPLVDAANELSAAEPTAVVPLLDAADQVLAHAVIMFRPFADLDATDREAVAASADLSSAAIGVDVYVDPRFGTFDASTGQVVALG
jgi:hypothetical protein